MCDLDVCRICLNTDVKGYKMGQYSLRSYYEQLTRKKVNLKDVLPQWVCYECATLLHKCHKFRQKCFHGESILKQLAVNGDITYERILSINRQNENLTSTIQLTAKNKFVRAFNFKYNRKQNFKIEIDIHKDLKNDKDKQNVDLILDDIVDEQKDKQELPKLIDLDKSLIQDNLVKNETVGEQVILIPNSVAQSGDPIKDELTENYIDIDKQLSRMFDMNNIETNMEKQENNNAENSTEENDNFDQDSDANFEIDNKAPSDTEDDDDDICLSETLNKRKRKTTAKSKVKSETRKKKMKSEYEHEEKVELKNTRPRKHFLNPQFWKKITLSEEEAVREFKQREFNNDYYLRAKYKCQNCFKGFSKNEMLVRHLKHWHDESCGVLECRFCRMRFRRKHQLVTHIQEHLIVHHCLRCNLHFSRLKTALFHQEHHNGIKRTCKHCGKEFNHLSTYYTHVRMSHRSAHVCVACGASFVSEHGLLQHTKFKHFDNLKQLEEEIRKRREASSKAEAVDNEVPGAAPQTAEAPQASAGEEIYCAKCDIQFMSRRAYNTHFFKSDNHDDGDAFAAVNKDGVTGGPGSNIRAKIPTTCEHCDKDFPSRQAYKKHHQAEHSHIPLYIPDERDICEICGASIQLGSIQYHMKSHTGEREFACPAPACGMRFTLKANMKRHYNVKHLGMPYPKYIRRTPGRRKKKTQEILENDFSPFVRTRTGYFL